MKLKRNSLLKWLVVLLVCCFCVVFTKQDDANAYFHTNKNKTAQCFAISYELSSYTEGTEYMSQGEKVNTDTMSYNNYATNKICAYIDESGKVSGNKLVDADKRPPDTQAIPFYPSLKLSSDGKSIVLTYCANGDHYCLNVQGGGREEKTFAMNNYTTFYELAKAVNDAAQDKYLGGTKQALKDSSGNEIATGVTDAMNEAIDERDEANDEEGNPVCYADSGALGWILCPLITMASGIGEGMWNQIEEYHMKIPAQKVFESGGGVETAWSTVRDIANVVFIILFLFVIFSQLTGIGIDNYGIKRILPKLVVVAVLMNLSYIICELAVDLSNILGVSLNGLLSSQADTMNMESAMNDAASNAAGSIGLTLSGGAVVFFTFLKEGSLLGAAGSIGLAVAGIVLIIVIAMLTLYVILTIREAGIIMAVVVAPVALVCYMLPNTEKIYKKWVDIFKALLLVYPICGAMVGAGQLAGAVLSTIDNSSMKVAAAIVQVVPFFLIPVVLKSSLALMGNVGAKLSSFGRAMGRQASSGLQGAVRGTERYKDWAQLQRENSAFDRSNRTLNRLQTRMANGQDLTPGQRRRFARATNIQHGIEQRRNEENLIAAEARYGDLGLDGLLAEWNTSFNENDGDLMTKTNLVNKLYGAAGAARISDLLESKTGIANNTNYQASMQSLRQTMNNNADFANNMRRKAPDAFQMIQDGARTYDANGRASGYADLDHFTQNQKAADKISDWAGASTSAIRRSVGAKNADGNYIITDRQLEEMLTSNDPAIRSGMMSEDGKYELIANEYERRTGRTAPNRDGSGGAVDIGPQPSSGSSTNVPRNVGGPGGADFVSE